MLATVVKTQGSSYRMPGARLLLTRDGERAGSVSGGCLEDDLVKRAWWFTERGAMVRRYDTTPDGEIAAEYGLGCNGIIHVALQRLMPGTPSVLDVLRQVRATRTPATVTHTLQPELDDGEVFTEQIVPPLRLLLCGAGDDAVPLCKLAAEFLGWQVLVYDGRAHYGRAERFPLAAQVTVTDRENLPAFPVDEWTVAAVMTHSYAQDLAFVRALGSLRLPYLGILGPQKRTVQLLAESGLPEHHVTSNLHSPMGLDIGADGPEQVALAVVAEIQAALNKRSGGQLRLRAGSIHSGSQSGEYSRSLLCV